MNTPVSALGGVRLMGAALVALLFVMAAPGMGAKPGAFAAESSRPEPARTAAQASPQQTPGAATQNTRDDAIVISNDAPGYNGYAGTWRDPETGDIVTSVIAPRRPQEQTQQQPIYIAPQIDPYWPGGNGGGNQGWNASGWQSGGNGGWNNVWNGGGQAGWQPGGNPGWSPSWRPGQQGATPPGPLAPGALPPNPTPPGAGSGSSGMAPPPPQAGQPGVPPPRPADRPGPGGLPLPDMQPGAQPPQAAIPPGQPGTPPSPQRPPAWEPPPGRPQNWQPQNWQPQNWQPQNWQPQNWQPGNWQPGAWRPWGPAGTSTSVKSWTPGQPPHGDWRPLSWSPGPAAAAAAWNPWQPSGPRRPYGMAAGMMGGMRPGMGMPGRFAAMPVLPPNITRHLGPVVPFSQRGGPR